MKKNYSSDLLFFKKSFFILLFAALAGGQTFGQATDLIISEYGEGNSGNSKYIELYNGTGASVNLANFRIALYANGSATATNTANLSGTLANGSTYVIGNNSSDVPGANTYLSGPMSFNGDDAVALIKNISSTWTVIDVVGQIGTDPGTGWAVAGTNNATVDKRLTRKATVCSPNTNWTSSAGTNTTNSEWIVSSSAYTTGAAIAGHTQTCTLSNEITTTAITANSYPVISGGESITVGTGTLDSKGMIWGLTAASVAALPTPSATNTEGRWHIAATGTAAFSAALAGVQPGTTIYYRAYYTTASPAATVLGDVKSYVVPAKGTSLAFWNFGPDGAGYTLNPTNTILSTATITATTGTGTYDTNGKDGFVYNGVARGQALTWDDVTAPTSTNFVVRLNTTGYGNIHFRADYLAQVGGTYTLAYSTNGSSYTNITTSGSIPTNMTVAGDESYNWGNIYHDLSSIVAFDNAADIYLRLTLNAGVLDQFQVDNIHFFGTALAPEMNMQGNGVNITDGDNTPTSADHTDFGSVCIAGTTSVTRTFTIQNTGTGPLNLTGANPYVVVTGTGFSLTANPTTPVAASGSTTFQVSFDPSVAGASTGTISIANNDADENPYNFSISGTGTDVPAQPGAISGITTPICQGTSQTYSISAVSGATNYTWSLPVGWTGTSTSTSITATAGANSGTVSVTANNACGSSTASVSASVTVNPLPANPTGTITASANPSCGPATLSYPAGTAPIVYYWQTSAAGTSTTQSTATNYTLNATGTIWVRAYNSSTGCFSAGSLSSGTISINNLATITDQPDDISVSVGNTAQFTVAASNASGYQWQVSTNGGGTWNNVTDGTGATSATYTTIATTIVMNGYQYRCIVTNSCGNINSDIAVLTVTTVPVPCYSQNFEVGGGNQSLATTSSVHCWTTSATPAFTTTSSDHTNGGTGNHRGISMNSSGQWAQTPSLGGTTGASVSYWAKPANTGTISISIQALDASLNVLATIPHTGISVWTSFTDPLPNGTYYVRFLYGSASTHYDDIEVFGGCSGGCGFYYRSAATGPAIWAAAASWEQSATGTGGWGPAADYPRSGALGVEVRATHTINISTSGIQVTNTNVYGTVRVITSSNFDVSGNEDVELTIKNGGVFSVENTGAATGTAFGLVETGGKVVAATGSDGTLFVDDYIEEDLGLFYFGDAAICEWNNAAAYPNSNGTADLFYPYNTGDMPVFRFTSMHPTFVYGNSSNANVINAVLELNTATSFKFAGSQTKTIMGGIRSIHPNGSAEQNTGSGNVIVGSGSIVPQISSTAGNTLTLSLLSGGLDLYNGASVPSPSNVVIQPKTNITTENQTIDNNVGSGPLTVAAGATLDITNMRITNGASAGVIVNGTLRTANTGGFSGTGSAIPGGTVTVNNTSGTIDYYATADQKISIRSDYYNMILQGGGNKTLYSNSPVTPIGGTVTINNNTTVDVVNNTFGSAGTNFTMTGGRFRTSGTGYKPDMGGTYTHTAGVVEFYNPSGEQLIQHGATHSYQNIEVTGASVFQRAGNINLNSGGSFTVKSGGIFTNPAQQGIVDKSLGTTTFLVMEPNSVFRTGNGRGFYGPAVSGESPSVGSTIDIITLQTGSTIEYMRNNASCGGSCSPNTNQPLTIPYSNGNPIAYQNLLLSGEGERQAPVATGTPGPTVGVLRIAGDLTKTGSTLFKHNDGVVEFVNSTTAQTFLNQSTNEETTFYDFINSNTTTGGLTINKSAGATNMAIVNKLQLNNNSNLKLNTADIRLKSSDDRTAFLDEIAAGAANADIIQYTGTARFIVERRIKYVKNWNLIAAPVWEDITPSDISIKKTWQGDATTPVNYGTLVTGPVYPSNGLDANSIGYSVKWWDATAATPAFKMIGESAATATDQVAVNNKHGFFVYARGDRSANTMPPALAGTSTTLSARGKLYIGINDVATASRPVAVTATATAANGFFMSAANPFASAIDFSDVYNNNIATNNLKAGYHVWDPTQSGNYSVGQYQHIATSGLVTPGIGLYTTAALGAGYKNIQSGQAFFVEANAIGPMALVFDEQDKVNVSMPSLNRNPEEMVLMSTMLHNAVNQQVADGNRVIFDEACSNGTDRDDASKIINTGENFGMIRNGNRLIVEGRKPVVESDTIYYNMSNLRNQNYTLSFEPRNLTNTGLIAELVDKYLNSRTPVSLSDSTYYNFAATSDAASKAADRFMLVFRTPSGPLPVTFVSIAAQRQTDRSIKINWEVANEVNIEHYEVQRSADGTNFSRIISADATNRRQYTKNDLGPLSADNFYRIKAIGIAGDITYSAIVKVAPDKQPGLIVVQPNPVKDKLLNIRFTNQPAGDYALQLTNALGQYIYSGTISVTNNAQVRMVNLPATVAGGNYQLIIRSRAGEVVYREVIVIE